MERRLSRVLPLPQQLRTAQSVVHADLPNRRRCRMDCGVKPGNDEWRDAPARKRAPPLA
jgi:hypothetical protein